MELGSHVWHLCHLAFDFWASLYHLLGALLPLGIWFLGISLPFVSFGVWLLAGEVLVWFGLFVWFECTDIWYKLFKLICVLLTLRFHTQPGNPLGKFFKWLVNLQLWSNDKKNGLKILDLYWHRIGKWTEVPLCPGLSLIINSLGLIKLRPPLPQRDNPCWYQSALVIRANLSTIWSKVWL